MAKKTRQARRQRTRKPHPRTSPAAPRAKAPTLAKEEPVTSKPTDAASASWREEYRYVYGDLKRIGILAGAMFLVLAILAVFLR